MAAVISERQLSENKVKSRRKSVASAASEGPGMSPTQDDVCRLPIVKDRLFPVSDRDTLSAESSDHFLIIINNIMYRMRFLSD